MVDWVQIGFIGVGVTAILATIAMIEAREIVHSLMAMVLVFLAVATLFLLLGAEFLFLVQILVYVGAITVVILFGIMLTKRRLGRVEEEEG